LPTPGRSLPFEALGLPRNQKLGEALLVPDRYRVESVSVDLDDTDLDDSSF
jgi:hypothetical protein